MNRLLKQYQIDVEFPEVSGAEHLQMLQVRDALAEIESSFTAGELTALATADKQLLAQADRFHAELSRFVDLAQRRAEAGIGPERWWWYLDVLSRLPEGAIVPGEQSMAA